MSWLRRLLCKHEEVVLKRAHRDVAGSMRNPHLAWVDYLRCHNFLHCAKCGAPIKLNRTTPIYGEPER